MRGQPGGFLSDPGNQRSGVSQGNVGFLFGNAFVSEPWDGLVLLVLPIRPEAELKAQWSLSESKPQCSSHKAVNQVGIENLLLFPQ